MWGAKSIARSAERQLDGCVDSRFSIVAEQLDETLGRLHTARIRTLTITPPSLDTLFLRSYRDTAAGAEHASGASGLGAASISGAARAEAGR
jgi:ABC-2 type transport system ATP-binding protein